MESNFNLNGKIALITGSAGGIGWATAKTLARYGASVILNDIKSKEILEERKQEIKSDMHELSPPWIPLTSARFCLVILFRPVGAFARG